MKEYWHSHGFDKDASDEEVMDAAILLGLLPEEALALSEHCDRERYVWNAVAGSHSDPDTCRLIAEFYRRRSLRMKELAAALESEYEVAPMPGITEGPGNTHDAQGGIA